MRRAKVDDNQSQIVADLRSLGCSVLHLHAVGQGCPDVLVGWRGRNVLLELKDGAKPPSRRKLTPAQTEFFDTWRGEAHVVSSTDEARAVVMREGWSAVHG